MSGPTDPKDAAACLLLAQRHAGDAGGWTPEQWQAQLAEDAVGRGDPPVAFYRPYRSALAYLLRPGQVKARKEGDASEDYFDVKATVEHLRDLDAEWQAQRIPPETVDADTGDTWNGQIDWGGW